MRPERSVHRPISLVGVRTRAEGRYHQSGGTDQDDSQEERQEPHCRENCSKLVNGDFTVKDSDAAEKASMPVAQYVIGGMDRAFKVRLYRLFRALDDAGLAPGMTSGFRDDYRQSIASGNKAAINRSYHGGSLRGGYGHGLAADVVSVKGETRSERCISSEILWKWIDAHGKDYGIGRPYLDKDPPHIAPIDGKEYADKRGLNAKVAEKGNAATSGVAKPAKAPQTRQGRAEPKPL